MTNDPTSNVIIYIVIFVIGILLTRAIFSIGAIVKNMQAQTRLLILIARKQGVDIKLLNDISALSNIYAPNLAEQSTLEKNIVEQNEKTTVS